MKSLSEDKFIDWINSHEIGLHDAYPKVVILSLNEGDELRRFWNVPSEPERRPYFISCLLDLLGNWDSFYVWRHMGSWPEVADPARINDVIELELLEGIGLPLGTNNIINFSKDDINKLISLIFVTTIFGWSVGEDLYIVPNHAKNIVKVDHHGVIHIEFNTDENMKKFIEEMETREFYLPDELPDETFKEPGWIKE